MRGEHLNNDLCKTAKSKVDNLPIRCIGDWGYQKIYRLVQYFGIFSKGMHKKWPVLNYVEICSGPGRCITRNNGQEINGTSLAVLKHPSFSDYLTQALFIDYNKEAVKVLNERIKNEALDHKAKATCVNFNDLYTIGQSLSILDNNSLNLVLIDPTECNLPFETIRKISNELKNVDFIITIPIETDIRRNIRRAILDDTFIQVRQKYSRFIGNDNFFNSQESKKVANYPNLEELINVIMEKYKNSWELLGYKYFREKSVQNYYRLMFASKHPKGLEFWDKANKYEPNGQMTLEGIF